MSQVHTIQIVTSSRGRYAIKQGCIVLGVYSNKKAAIRKVKQLLYKGN